MAGKKDKGEEGAPLKKKKGGLDLMSVIGFVFAIGLMIIGIILVHDRDLNTYHIDALRISDFWDLTSVAIVVGGTFACLFIAFPASQLAKVPKHLKIIFFPRKHDPYYYIDTIVECAKKARINGLLSLEEDVRGMDDAFLKNGLMMVVDSVDPEKVKQQLDSWLDNLDERHEQDRALYDLGATLAPAFGMIGTLIGLINMLKDLQDISSVGPNMAVALVTTFYGSVLSNLVFAPVSNKLRVRHDEEYLCMMLVSEGIQAIQAGENPKFIEDRLIHFLPQYQQKSGEDEQGEAGGKKKKKKKK